MSSGDSFDPTSYLDYLFTCVEDSDRVEAELEGEYLHIYANNKEYLIHWHGVKKEMWVSSPKSGAHHFVPKKKQNKPKPVCLSTRDSNVTLENLLTDELGVFVRIATLIVNVECILSIFDIKI